MNPNNRAVVPETLLTIPEVAERLGITERLAQKLVYTRQLPTVKIGRLVRVHPDDLAAYVADHTRPAGVEVTR
ncbi:MAG: helix-turn-helix domain-containing protein [Leucobacter sp.]